MPSYYFSPCLINSFWKNIVMQNPAGRKLRKPLTSKFCVMFIWLYPHSKHGNLVFVLRLHRLFWCRTTSSPWSSPWGSHDLAISSFPKEGAPPTSHWLPQLWAPWTFPDLHYKLKVSWLRPAKLPAPSIARSDVASSMGTIWSFLHVR